MNFSAKIFANLMEPGKLCCANGKLLELDADDIAGLYWTFENILEDIAETLKMLEKAWHKTGQT